MIWQKQKLILIAVVYLMTVFLTAKNIPVAYAQSTRGMIYYHQWGYFKADNGILGGPSCGVCVLYGENECISRHPGITGYFTEDSACKAAYGSDMIAGIDFGRYASPVSLCGVGSALFRKVECIIPLPPPCAEWKDGVCKKVDTSLLQGGDKSKGSMPVDTTEFVVRIFTIILNFAGGIALLLVISAGYKLLTSKGKPEAIQQGRDQLISAIVGLVFIIFSFVIFQLVFVDILKIPGFTR